MDYLLLNGQLSGYNVQYRIKDSGMTTTIYQPGSKTEINVTNIQFDTNYTVRVGAVATGGNGSLSMPTQVNTLQASEY